MRKTLALLALTGLVLTSCSSDSGNVVSSSSKKSASSSSKSKKTPSCLEGVDCKGDPFAKEDSSKVNKAKTDAASVAESLSAGLGVKISKSQSDCVLKGMFQRFDLSELSKLDSRTPTSDQVEKLGSTLDDCLSKDVIKKLFAKQFSELDPAVATCAADALADEFGFADLMRAGYAVTGGKDAAFLADFKERAQAAGATCAAGDSTSSSSDSANGTVAQTQSNLNDAMTNADVLYTDGASYLVDLDDDGTATLEESIAVLQQAEPALTWQTSASTGPSEISVDATNQTIVLAALSTDDTTCYVISDDRSESADGSAAQYVEYPATSTAPCEAATALEHI